MRAETIILFIRFSMGIHLKSKDILDFNSSFVMYGGLDYDFLLTLQPTPDTSMKYKSKKG